MLQDILLYAFHTITIGFTTLMLFDFVTSLMPVEPAPLIDLTPIFEAIDLELSEELHLQVPETEIDPWFLSISNSKKPTWLSMGEIHNITSVPLLLPACDPVLPSTKNPNFASMTHLALTEMCAGHGIPHQKPGNKRKTKKELIADLKRVMAESRSRH